MLAGKLEPDSAGAYGLSAPASDLVVVVVLLLFCLQYSTFHFRRCSFAEEVPVLNVSYKPQKISPKSQVSATCSQLLTFHVERLNVLEGTPESFRVSFLVFLLLLLLFFMDLNIVWGGDVFMHECVSRLFYVLVGQTTETLFHIRGVGIQNFGRILTDAKNRKQKAFFDEALQYCMQYRAFCHTALLTYLPRVFVPRAPSADCCTQGSGTRMCTHNSFRMWSSPWWSSQSWTRRCVSQISLLRGSVYSLHFYAFTEFRTNETPIVQSPIGLIQDLRNISRFLS